GRLEVGEDRRRQRPGRLHQEQRGVGPTQARSGGQAVGEVGAGGGADRLGSGEEGRGHRRRGAVLVLAVDGGRRLVRAGRGQRTADRVADVVGVRRQVGGGLGSLGGAVSEEDRAVLVDGGRDGRQRVGEVEAGRLEDHAGIAHLLGDRHRGRVLVAPG